MNHLCNSEVSLGEEEAFLSYNKCYLRCALDIFRVIFALVTFIPPFLKVVFDLGGEAVVDLEMHPPAEPSFSQCLPFTASQPLLPFQRILSEAVSSLSSP